MDIRLMALNILAPMLRKIVLDMITNKRVTAARENTLALLQEIAAKTDTEFDDYFIESYVTEALKPENFNRYGTKLLAWAKAFVLHTATDWDDTWILPILVRFEEVMALPE